MPDRTPAEQEAYELGREHAIAQASWVIDGHTAHEAIVRVIALLDDGDDIADYLPARPNLSGEWADHLTPRRLYEEITGRDAHSDATWNQDAYQAALESLCEAYEEGVDDHFYQECERVLRAALAD